MGENKISVACLVVIFSTVLAVIQFAAVMSGLIEWLDWSYPVAIIVALITAGFSRIPIIGPIFGMITGVMGAHVGWDWPLWGAILLFAAWPLICIGSALWETFKSK